MYIPAHFRETRREVLFTLIHEHPFGTLVSLVDGELFATHVPFLVDQERGPNGTLVGHLARANPHWRGFGSQALAIFQGPHAYVSPSWYATELSVPTWNYTTVHAYGVPSVVADPARVRAVLEATVTTFEAGFAEPWSTRRLPEHYIARLAQAIVAFELPITRLEGKRKLGQNRSTPDVESAVAGLRKHGDALGLAVADLMAEAATGARA
jgi:transcriptional regulator